MSGDGYVHIPPDQINVDGVDPRFAEPVIKAFEAVLTRYRWPLSEKAAVTVADSDPDATAEAAIRTIDGRLLAYCILNTNPQVQRWLASMSDKNIATWGTAVGQHEGAHLMHIFAASVHTDEIIERRIAHAYGSDFHILRLAFPGGGDKNIETPEAEAALPPEARELRERVRQDFAAAGVQKAYARYGMGNIRELVATGMELHNRVDCQTILGRAIGAGFDEMSELFITQSSPWNTWSAMLKEATDGPGFVTSGVVFPTPVSTDALERAEAALHHTSHLSPSTVSEPLGEDFQGIDPNYAEGIRNGMQWFFRRYPSLLDRVTSVATFDDPHGSRHRLALGDAGPVLALNRNAELRQQLASDDPELVQQLGYTAAVSGLVALRCEQLRNNGALELVDDALAEATGLPNAEALHSVVGFDANSDALPVTERDHLIAARADLRTRLEQKTSPGEAAMASQDMTSLYTLAIKSPVDSRSNGKGAIASEVGDLFNTFAHFATWDQIRIKDATKGTVSAHHDSEAVMARYFAATEKLAVGDALSPLAGSNLRWLKPNSWSLSDAVQSVQSDDLTPALRDKARRVVQAGTPAEVLGALTNSAAQTSSPTDQTAAASSHRDHGPGGPTADGDDRGLPPGGARPIRPTNGMSGPSGTAATPDTTESPRISVTSTSGTTRDDPTPGIEPTSTAESTESPVDLARHERRMELLPTENATNEGTPGAALGQLVNEVQARMATGPSSTTTRPPEAFEPLIG